MPSMVASTRSRRTPLSRALPCTSSTPQEETPARNASAGVICSPGPPRWVGSSIVNWFSRTWLMARPGVGVVADRTRFSTSSSSVMVSLLHPTKLAAAATVWTHEPDCAGRNAGAAGGLQAMGFPRHGHGPRLPLPARYRAVDGQNATDPAYDHGTRQWQDTHRGPERCPGSGRLGGDRLLRRRRRGSQLAAE